MTDVTAATSAPTARRGTGQVVVTGTAVLSAYGPGTEALLSGVLSGRPAFAPVERFDVSARRVGVAATMPGARSCSPRSTRAVREACDDAGLSAVRPRPHPAVPRHPRRSGDRPGRRGGQQAQRSGRGIRRRGRPTAAAWPEQGLRCYTSACVAASTAIADAAAIIARGHADRVVVAGGYLVEPDQFALFDAGRVLADDGQVRPFSAGRRGLLLGDGVGAVVIESREAARARRRAAAGADRGLGPQPATRTTRASRARKATAWPGRSRPRCSGPASRAADIGYINAHGSGTAAERPGRGERAAARARRRRRRPCRSAPPSRCTVRPWRPPACSS